MYRILYPGPGSTMPLYIMYRMRIYCIEFHSEFIPLPACCLKYNLTSRWLTEFSCIYCTSSGGTSNWPISNGFEYVCLHDVWCLFNSFPFGLATFQPQNVHIRICPLQSSCRTYLNFIFDGHRFLK